MYFRKSFLMSRRIFTWLALALALAPIPSLRAQDYLIAGFSFSQFLGEGYPSISGVDFLPVSSIDATYTGASVPDSNLVDGVYVGNNALEGYTSDIATWSFANFDFSNAVDVRADTFGTLNTVNSTTVHTADVIASDLALTDTQGMMLTFQAPGVKWDIRMRTLGFSDTTTAPNLSFAARAPGGAVTVDWFVNGGTTPFASTVVQAGSVFAIYQVDLPSAFYGRAEASIQGSLRNAGLVSFDNVQINGSLAQAPVFEVPPQDQTVTVGSTVEFSVVVSGADSPIYQWKLDGRTLNDQAGIVGATTANLVLSDVTLAQSGVYTVEVNNNGIVAESEGAELRVQSGPAIVRPLASTSANPGQTAVFEVDAGGVPAPTYRWEKDGGDIVDGPGISGATTNTLTLAFVTLASAGEYRVVVTNAAGTASSTATLTVTEAAVAPTISTPLAPTVAVAGASAQLFVVASGAPSPTYAWTFEGAPLTDGNGISGATTNRLIIAEVTPARAGLYAVAVTNSAGSVASEARLTVQVAPSITLQPAPLEQSVLVGTTVQYRVEATGTPAPTYQWFHGDDPIPGATSALLELESVDTDDSGTYLVRVSNAAGHRDSVPVDLLVGVAPEITLPPVSQTVIEGGRVEFSVTATGTPAPAFQWFKDGELLEDETASTLVVFAATPQDAGAYSVRVFNALGASTSEAARLGITQGVSITSPNRVQVFAPGSVLSLGTAFDAGNVRYQWSLNGKAIPGATRTYHLIDGAAFADSGTYSIKVYNSQGRLLATKVVAKIVISVAGTYEALLRDTTTSEPVGRIALAIAATGAFTGKLVYEDGKAYALKGRFTFPVDSAAGLAGLTIKRAGALPSFFITLSLDARSSVLDCELGTAGEETSFAEGGASSRLAASARPAWAGTYALSLAPRPTELPDQPTATAVLKAVVARQGGAMRITGRLADGTAISASVPSSIDADYAVWLKLYSGKGFLAGDLSLEEISAGVYAADAESSGDFAWFRAPNAKSKVFPGGIDLLLEPTLEKP